jgi:hypothetical protein
MFFDKQWLEFMLSEDSNGSLRGIREAAQYCNLHEFGQVRFSHPENGVPRPILEHQLSALATVPGVLALIARLPEMVSVDFLDAELKLHTVRLPGRDHVGLPGSRKNCSVGIFLPFEHLATLHRVAMQVA